MKKIGRNEQCPCGSGKKFKKCHGNSIAPTQTPGQVDAQLRKLVPKAECLSPTSFHVNCKGKIIASHTVSRSGSLGAIAKDGHVYSYKISMQKLTALNGEMEPTLTGWREASTFPGFCGAHDKSIFSPLEDQPFTGSDEQCYLLAYRALVWEYYAKLLAARRNGFRLAASAMTGSSRKNEIANFNNATDLGLSDLSARKLEMDSALELRDWSSLNGILLEFDEIFPIQCAAAWSPTEDIYGRYLQSISDPNKVPEGATISSFAANEKSYLLVTWMENSNKTGTKLAKSIEETPDLEKAGALAAFLLITSENCHLSPEWFDALDKNTKDTINALMHPIRTPDSAFFYGTKVGIGKIGISSCRRIGANQCQLPNK